MPFSLSYSSMRLHTACTHVDAPRYTEESQEAPWRRAMASEVGKLRLRHSGRMSQPTRGKVARPRTPNTHSF